MKRHKLNLAALAIVVIGILEAIALIQDIDGAVFGLALAVIAGLAGYKIKSPSK